MSLRSLKPRPDWSPLGVTKSLSHAQMVSFRGLNPKFPTSIPVCSIWGSPPRVIRADVETGYRSCIAYPGPGVTQIESAVGPCPCSGKFPPVFVRQQRANLEIRSIPYPELVPFLSNTAKALGRDCSTVVCSLKAVNNHKLWVSDSYFRIN